MINWRSPANNFFTASEGRVRTRHADIRGHHPGGAHARSQRWNELRTDLPERAGDQDTPVVYVHGKILIENRLMTPEGLVHDR